MNSRIKERLNMKTQPVAVLKADGAPEGAMGFKAGAMGACMIGMLEAVSKGRTAAFTPETCGCGGGMAGLGFAPMNRARIGNRYITECEPWKVWKTDPKRCETILNISLQLTANLAIAFEPFLPFSSKKLRQMLNIDSFEWEQLGSTDILKPGHQLAEPELLFEKIEDEVIQKQLDKLEATKRANEAAAYKAQPIKENVDFSEWEKLDIRVGHIKNCEKVKKAKKLLKFTLDDGSGTDRTIVSGIAAYYEPEDLIGKDVLFIANLAPRKLMGIESQGMILSAENFDGSLSVTTTLREVKPGSPVC